MDASDRYRQLAERVDGFFQRVLERHADHMQCGSGCHDCCRVRLTITGVEADAVRRGLAHMATDRRQALQQQARRRNDAWCAALDPAGRCSIYPFRPLVCRSHGVPLRLGATGSGDEPALEVCERNFTALPGGPAGADPDCVLDQQTLSTVLLAVDRARADQTGDPPGQRFDLADILAEGDDRREAA